MGVKIFKGYFMLSSCLRKSVIAFSVECMCVVYTYVCFFFFCFGVP